MAHFHAIGDFADENDRVPTAEEFAELTGVQEKTAKLILRTLSPFTEGPVLTTFIPDITTDESTATPEENMIFFELVKLIRSKLTENEWLIFKQYVIEGVKLAKIGKDRGYTEANASQTVQKIRRKIERSLRRLGFDVNGHSKSECRSAFHKIDMERIILDILEDNRGKPVFIFQAVMARLTADGVIKDTDKSHAVSSRMCRALKRLVAKGYSIKRNDIVQKNKGLEIWLDGVVT